MKFDISVVDLKNLLKKTKPFTGKTLCTTDIKIEAGKPLRKTLSDVYVTATDLEKQIKTVVETNVETSGAAIVSWALLNKFVSTLKTGDVTIESSDDSVSFTCGKRNRTIKQTTLVSEYPNINPVYDDVVHTLSSPHKIEAVVESASTDDCRPILTGVLLRGNMAATDSYRLSVVHDVCPDLGFDVLVPSDFMSLMSGLGSFEYQVSEDHKWLRVTDGWTVYDSRLIEGQFPNYKGLLPDNVGGHSNVVFNSKDLMHGLTVLSKSGFCGTKAKSFSPLRISNDGVLKVVEDGVGEESYNVGLLPESKVDNFNHVGLNVWFLMGIVKHCVGVNVTLNVLDAVKPVTIYDDDCTFLLMPVRMHDV